MACRSVLLVVLAVASCARSGLPAAPALLDDASTTKLKSPSRGPSNGQRHFLASALSGAAGVTALAPLEVLRLSLMLKSDQTMQGAIRTITAQGGWFRGNSADTIAAALKVGVTMPAFAFFKQALTQAATRWGGLPEDAPAPRWIVFAAGALAGTTAQIVTFPLEVVRTRLAMECPLDMNVATCLYSIGSTEGVGALYRGLTATVAGVLPFSSIKLATYDLLRRRATEGLDDMTVSVSLQQSAFFGAIAGIVAATSCFPLEVVRRRQMIGDFASLSAWGAIRTIVSTEGAGVLYKGVGLNLIKTGMANSLGFSFYEFAKDALAVDGRRPPWQKLGQHTSADHVAGNTAGRLSFIAPPRLAWAGSSLAMAQCKRFPQRSHAS